jgi:hypothetical protein
LQRAESRLKSRTALERERERAGKEVNYQNVTTQEVLTGTEANELVRQNNHLDTHNPIYKREDEYYVVTKVVKSPKFSVFMKATNDIFYFKEYWAKSNGTSNTTFLVYPF